MRGIIPPVSQLYFSDDQATVCAEINVDLPQVISILNLVSHLVYNTQGEFEHPQRVGVRYRIFILLACDVASAELGCQSRAVGVDYSDAQCTGFVAIR